MRTFLNRVPRPSPCPGSIFTRPEREALMVFRGKGNVLCSRALKYIGPVCGVEEFRVELRSEVGVRVVGAVKFFVHLPAASIHRSGVRLLAFGNGVPVPLGIGEFTRENRCIGWHRIHAPVNEDAEFGGAKPGWDCTPVERLP